MMNRTSSRTRIIAGICAAAVIIAGIIALRGRHADAAFTFTQQDLQQRLAAKFPFDQKLLFITVTYSNPEVVMRDGSDRVGVALDAAAKLSGSQVVKGRVAGDWKVRYEPSEGALFLDDPRIEQIDIQGLSPSTQEMISRVAKPLMEAYLRRTPVYRLKPGDIRQELARMVLKSVTVRNGRLVVVIGPPG